MNGGEGELICEIKIPVQELRLKMLGGAYMRGGAYMWDTTVTLWLPLPI